MAIKKSDLYSSLWASCDELRGGMDAVSTRTTSFSCCSSSISLTSMLTRMTLPARRDSKRLKLQGHGRAEREERHRRQDQYADHSAADRCQLSPCPNGLPRLQRSQQARRRPGDGRPAEQPDQYFQKPELDFSNNRAEHDDILGDAYEYLMRHFAIDSGKSKGQFLTPAEVSIILAKVIGISPKNSKASTTAHDPTCGSGSLLLKVAAQAGKRITLEARRKM